MLASLKMMNYSTQTRGLKPNDRKRFTAIREGMGVKANKMRSTLLIKNILPFPHKDIQGKKDFTTGHAHPLPLLRFYNIWSIPFQCSCLQDLFPSSQVASPSFFIEAV